MGSGAFWFKPPQQTMCISHVCITVSVIPDRYNLEEWRVYFDFWVYNQNTRHVTACHSQMPMTGDREWLLKLCSIQRARDLRRQWINILKSVFLFISIRHWNGDSWSAVPRFCLAPLVRGSVWFWDWYLCFSYDPSHSSLLFWMSECRHCLRHGEPN